MQDIKTAIGEKNFQKIIDYRKNLLNNRQNLFDLLPLNEPITISVGLTNRCNFGCVFCPTGDLELTRKSNKIATGMMSDKVFYKIIDDVLKFKKKIRKLSLTGFGEPFLHKNIVNYLKFIKEKKATEKVSITTNGSLLQRFDMKEIVQNLDEIIFSIEHVNKTGYKKVTRNFDNFDLILDNIKKLYQAKIEVDSRLKIHIKTLDLGLSDSDKRKFFDLFEKFSDTINIDFAHSFTHSDKYDFSLGTNISQKTKDGFDRNSDDNMVCSQLFMYLKTIWNGNVVACCADWKHELIIGNIFENSLLEIWNGEKLNQLRLTHIYKSKNLIGPCKNCDFIKIVNPKDDLTPYRDNLKQIFK